MTSKLHHTETTKRTQRCLEEGRPLPPHLNPLDVPRSIVLDGHLHGDVLLGEVDAGGQGGLEGDGAEAGEEGLHAGSSRGREIEEVRWTLHQTTDHEVTAAPEEGEEE